MNDKIQKLDYSDENVIHEVYKTDNMKVSFMMSCELWYESKSLSIYKGDEKVLEISSEYNEIDNNDCLKISDKANIDEILKALDRIDESDDRTFTDWLVSVMKEKGFKLVRRDK